MSKKSIEIMPDYNTSGLWSEGAMLNLDKIHSYKKPSEYLIILKDTIEYFYSRQLDWENPSFPRFEMPKDYYDLLDILVEKYKLQLEYEFSDCATFMIRKLSCSLK